MIDIIAQEGEMQSAADTMYSILTATTDATANFTETDINTSPTPPFVIAPYQHHHFPHSL